MRKHPSPGQRRLNGVVHYATGYGVRVHVSRGHLIIEDGTGSDRRTTRYNRATGQLRRLVVVASTGYISFEAVRWMTDAGCALIQLDHTGRVLVTTATPGNDQPALRRAQALAAHQGVGVEISRQLLAAKLHGQQIVAARLDADAAAVIREHEGRLARCVDLDTLRLSEAQAAATYWAAWRGVQVRFATRDADRVPDHWKRFSQRSSPLTGSPRVAIDPANAVANLLYALLEAESTIALAAVGLDPGIGILHTDQRARDSLALDLMEAARPTVDRYLVDLLSRNTFAAAEFGETSAGQCRIMPTLARRLAGTALTWAGEVAPHAEGVARTLATSAGIEPPPTRLTGHSRRVARPDSDRNRGYRSVRPRPLQTCQDCGVFLPHGVKRCPPCHQSANIERLRAHQAIEAKGRRSKGEHPSARPDVRARIAHSQRAQWSARREASPGGFTGTHSEFRRLILPRLILAAPSDLARVTGLSAGYCAQIRNGKRMPHLRHWAALQLAGLQAMDAHCEAKNGSPKTSASHVA
jgi:CRISPR-associated protein Cas1